jgi:hypothetical protein
MLLGWSQQRLRNFTEWWRSPVTRKVRLQGSVVGGLGGFWYGVLGRLLIGPMPVDLSVIGVWALGSVIVGTIAGIAFPKATICICYPFSIFGGGVGT